MSREQWRIKRYYFLTSFAVLIMITVGMGIYFVQGKYSEFEQYALNDKLTNIENKKIILKNIVDSFINQINFTIKRSENLYEERIINRVHTAYSIAEKIRNDMGNRYSDNEIKAGIKAALSSMVFGSNYVFIVTTEGKIISSPPLPDLEGKVMLDQKDSYGQYTVRNTIKLAKEHGEGFVDVYWRKPGEASGELRKKKVFVKLFKPFNWIIGYGEYQDEFENELKNEVLVQIDNISYENNGYLFATSYNGISLTRPAKGKYMYDVQDVNGKYIVRELIEKAKEGGGYVEYVMPPFKGARPENKLSYVAPVEDWGWYVGAGIYITDIEAAYKKRLDELYGYARRETYVIIGTLLALLVFGGVAVFIFSGVLQKIVDSYSDEINSKNTELEELNLSLEEKVVEKTFELNRLNKSLEMRVQEEVAKNREKDRIMFQQGRLAAMGEMIGNIAHQWRQPLSSISLLIQDIQEAFECGEMDEEYLAGTVEKCTKTIGHMSDTIDNFRYFFNPDKKQERFSINAEIEKCLNLLDAGIENNHIHIRLNLGEDMHAFGVPGEYAQVIVNIVNNARDILLSRGVEEPLITIESALEDGRAIVRICDNGGGVDPAIIDRIFEPYFTTKSQSKGTGIGLYFSKMIIEGNMAGRLRVTNVGDGACFIFEVPAAE